MLFGVLVVMILLGINLVMVDRYLISFGMEKVRFEIEVDCMILLFRWVVIFCVFGFCILLEVMS